MVDKQFKEEILYSYSFGCFYNFKKEYNTLMHAHETYANKFEKIVYLLNRDGLHIVGIFSDVVALKNEKEHERVEYERLKNEFEPDPEDSKETVRITAIEVAKDSTVGFFKKLFRK